jgi:phospholipase C
MASGDEQLRHVIVVMLENRSFDHLLGYLEHPAGSAFDGIRPGTDTNPLDPSNPAAGVVHAQKRDRFRLRLRVDPDHAHASVMIQLGLSANQDAEPTNSGFVWNYEQKATGRSPGSVKGGLGGRILNWAAAAVALAGAVLAVIGLLWGLWLLLVAAALLVVRSRFVGNPDYFPGDGPRIMWCWDPKTIPAIAGLATSFGLCQRWFCSVPGETWPNRQFAHAATSAGTVDIVTALYRDRTIFELLDDNGCDWRIYYDGPPQVACYPALWEEPEKLARWHEIQQLFEHIAAGNLPTYSFIEPNHGYLGRSYSQHPGNNRKTNADFTRADGFIAAVYEALRANPGLFAQTLLLVTWDEHGGTFDHEPPPVAVPPDARTEQFDFKRLGVRVPAIVISPWVAAGTLDSDTIHDHASIPATLRQHFAPQAPPLNDREAAAKSFLPLLTLSEPRPADQLPDLSGHVRRPRAAWNPLDPVIGWLRKLFRGEEGFNTSLARLSAHLDAAVSPAPTRGAPPILKPGTASAPLPRPPALDRHRSSRAMKKFMTAAKQARQTIQRL